VAFSAPLLVLFAGSGSGDVSSRFTVILAASWLRLHIRDKPCYILMVYRFNYGRLSKITLIFSRFGSENVACKRMPSFNFAGTGLFKALSSSSVCLDLGHY
jgi:hypothetical protein